MSLSAPSKASGVFYRLLEPGTEQNLRGCNLFHISHCGKNVVFVPACTGADDLLGGRDARTAKAFNRRVRGASPRTLRQEMLSKAKRQQNDVRCLVNRVMLKPIDSKD